MRRVRTEGVGDLPSGVVAGDPAALAKRAREDGLASKPWVCWAGQGCRVRRPALQLEGAAGACHPLCYSCPRVRVPEPVLAQGRDEATWGLAALGGFKGPWLAGRLGRVAWGASWRGRYPRQTWSRGLGGTSVPGCCRESKGEIR